MKALVIGAGVIGLTTAVVLAEAGYEVTIWAREAPPRDTATAAAAIWYPSASASEPRMLSRGWALQTLAELRHLSSSGTAG